MSGSVADCGLATGILRRFASSADTLLRALLKPYSQGLRPGRTSFRPAEIEGRCYSPRQDDRRLHVDAFPTRPTQGQQILRIFTNLSPVGRARQWRVGERFESLAARFLPRVPPSAPVRSRLRAMLGLTAGVRSPYDEMMLALHDRMKLDGDYQNAVPFVSYRFAAGST